MLFKKEQKTKLQALFQLTQRSKNLMRKENELQQMTNLPWMISFSRLQGCITSHSLCELWSVGPKSFGRSTKRKTKMFINCCMWSCYIERNLVVLLVFSMFVPCKLKAKSVAQWVVSLLHHIVFMCYSRYFLHGSNSQLLPMAELQAVGSNMERPNLQSNSLCTIC